jgi:hypothetical protein
MNRTCWTSRAPRLRAGLALLLLGPLMVATGACAQAVPPDSDLLFRGGSGSLSAEDRAEIHALLGVTLVESPEGTLQVEGVECSQPTEVEVTLRDLDGDGREEVFVALSNFCLYGNTGTATSVFIRDGEGTFRRHLGFPGFVDVLEDDIHLGFPDLLIGGPGFCFPVWRWNGEAYDFHRQEEQIPGGCPEAG